MVSGNPQSAIATAAVRLRSRSIARMAMARRWRARHPLAVDMFVVITALVIFALLLADRQRLVQELVCNTNR
jgi:hypothetical protein